MHERQGHSNNHTGLGPEAVTRNASAIQADRNLFPPIAPIEDVMRRCLAGPIVAAIATVSLASVALADDASDKPVKPEAPPPINGRYQGSLIPQSEPKPGTVVTPVFLIFDTALGTVRACSITPAYTGATRFNVNC